VSSRARFVAAVFVLTVLTLGGAFAAVYLAFNRLQERQLDQALITAARVEARMLSQQPSEAVALSNRPGPAANQVGPLATFAAVLDGAGAVVALSPTLAAAPSARGAENGRAFDLWIQNQHARCVWMDVEGRAGVRLFFAVPREDLDGDAAFLSRAMTVAFLVAVVWAAAIAYWIVRVFTNEQRRIAEVARRVADGDLTARISSRTRDRDMARFALDLDQMIERLALLVSSQQRFIAYAAHELRSPLTMLYGELSHALRRSRSADEYRRAIEEALDATRSLKQLSEDLLALARVSEGANATSERVSLREVTDEAVASVLGEALARDVELVAECGEQETMGHPRDIERLLRNLLENAVRHAPRGTSVRLRVRETDAMIELAVSDQGSGVSEGERERIFEPFYRSASEEKDGHAGAGLGLAIARDIARAHGGDVRVDVGEGGVGAVFTATIRCAAQK
jgi:two-component system heavy metal sensor histidine kinase CusS